MIEECSEDEIEITPAMIEAGCEALWDTEYGSCPTTRSAEVVELILEASLRAAGFSLRTP